MKWTKFGSGNSTSYWIQISGSYIGEYKDGCSGILCHVVWNKLTDVSEVLAASIIRSSP
jgi:hypothetical protein